MKYAVIKLDSENRIIDSRLYDDANDGEIEVDSLPNGNIGDYLYVNNEYIYSPLNTITEEQLNQLKEQKIALSKSMLADYLQEHPMTWVDGNTYSVTSEKQSLLTSNLALYQIAVAAGQPFKLTWNTTGEECKEWTYENLTALALAIGIYVKPFVSQQQEVEVTIRKCKTEKEINDVVIKYGDINE